MKNVRDRGQLKWYQEPLWLLMIPSPSRPQTPFHRASVGCLYEKESWLFARANSPRARFDCLVLIELTLLSEPSCYMEKNWPGSEGDSTIANVWLGQSGHSSSQANSLFLNINSSPHFVRKCTKSRLTQGSSGRNRYISTRENFSPYLQGFKKRFLKWNRV